jgi:mannitol/fructose-specific phosphotransferase system IIA component (Ntr-type)
MKLSDFVVPGAIIANLKAVDRNDAIRELIDGLCDAGALAKDDAPIIAKATIQRENQGSTGFGKGVAVPPLDAAPTA